MEEFKWIPGAGIDAECLARLRNHFRRPHEPMGESWFMGDERRMFPELLGDLDALSAADLAKPLGEIASGYGAFGPRQEWHDWYHYLFAQLLPRAHDGRFYPLIELLVTGFIAIYPNGIHSAPYNSFRKDVTWTLGRAVMQPECWQGRGLVVGTMLHRSDANPNQIWAWWDASGDFSSSMFFCLKYLPDDQVRGWLQSVLAIPSPHWRAQVLAWSVGAHDILTGKVHWPGQFNIHARPAIGWDWSHCLTAELARKDSSGATPMAAILNDSVRKDVVAALERHFTEDVFLEWLTSISNVDYLERELAEIPSTFERLYMGQ